MPVIPDTAVSCFIFQDQYSEMRISINQKPGKSHNFGFTANWNTSGVFVQSIEKGKFIFNPLRDFVPIVNALRLSNKGIYL